MSRRYLVAGNWKMHGSQTMTAELISGIAKQLGLDDDSGLGFDVLVCPPTAYLSAAQKSIESIGSTIKLGAQDVNENESGAFTGETSLSMLSEFGCQYVLLGHSERRTLFGESDQSVAGKFAACVANQANIVPVLCIGETLSDRQAGNTEQVVARQLDAVIEKVGIQGFDNAVIAYEPVWAIGTGETASPEQAQQVHAYIREKLHKLDPAIAEKTQILYGGSVKAANAEELFAQTDIDGGLIGGASLDAESFAGICEAARKLAS